MSQRAPRSGRIGPDGHVASLLRAHAVRGRCRRRFLDQGWAATTIPAALTRWRSPQPHMRGQLQDIVRRAHRATIRLAPSRDPRNRNWRKPRACLI